MGSTAMMTHPARVYGEPTGWKVVLELVLDGISSRHTRRAYSQALEEFLIWFCDVSGRQFNKAAVQKYRAELEAKGLAPSSINQRLSAIRLLALEASDNGAFNPELAAGIARTKGVKRSGVRLGHWLTAEQAEQILVAPDLTTLKGLRDAALLAMLFSGGLRRSEVAGLEVNQFQQRSGRWLVADVLGKHGRIRSVPIPLWASETVTRWLTAAGIRQGPAFRPVTRHGTVLPVRISPQTVYDVVKFYGQFSGMELAPHDTRRTFAQLAHHGRAPLEQIQLSLGHASVVTTEIYLGIKQDLRDAPCDRLGLRPTPPRPGCHPAPLQS
jgi:site-specific recombinase XerD